MPWYIYDENGHQERGPFKSRASAISQLRHIQMYSTSHTLKWSVAYGEEDSNTEIAVGIAFIFMAIFGIFQWLVGTKAGRQTIIVFAVLTLIGGIINAYENRAYVDTAYYENGNIKAEQSFEHKKLNGISKFYLADGKLAKQQNFKNGLLEGASIEYFSNGKMKIKQSYKAGKLDGVTTTYFENGKAEREQTYKNDVKNGPSKIYYPSGKIKSEAMISNNQLNGESVLYDEKGKVLRRDIFKNGKSTSIVE